MDNPQRCPPRGVAASADLSPPSLQQPVTLFAVSGASITLLAILVLQALFLAGCRSALPAPEQRWLSAEIIARQAGWQASLLDAGNFQLQAFAPQHATAAQRLTIYIEGDGLPWASRSRPSTDPTPVRPVALELAVRDPGAAVYLARPCHYQGAGTPGCDQSVWTSDRFSERVVASSDAAIDQLKNAYSASELRLVGYSGGAAVAALVAARRTDVTALVTVAGNLDHATWTRHHRVTPLRGSLNPADHWQALGDIPQLHFVGTDDRIVPASIADSYVSAFPGNARHHLVRVEHFSHGCCWKDAWPMLINMADMPTARGISRSRITVEQE